MMGKYEMEYSHSRLPIYRMLLWCRYIAFVVNVQKAS